MAGKYKEIFKAKSLVEIKKTLVFYKGRAPKGEKMNWVTHEFILEGKFSLQNLPKNAKNEWVICRVFQKTTGEKKIQISGIMRSNSSEDEIGPPLLPPLMDFSPYNNGASKPHNDPPEFSHVHCLSNAINTAQKSLEDMFMDYFINPPFTNSSNPMEVFSRGQIGT